MASIVEFLAAVDDVPSLSKASISDPGQMAGLMGKAVEKLEENLAVVGIGLLKRACEKVDDAAAAKRMNVQQGGSKQSGAQSVQQ